jgi:hypothetical protein
MLKNEPNQKWRIIAFRSDNTRVTGDAANITAKIAIDHGPPVPLTDLNPTETEDGYYLFDLTQAETNGWVLELYPESTSPDVLVLGDPPSVFTRPIITRAY